MLKSTLTRLREARMQEFEGDGAAEAGFTLIELMVVLLIIAILLAIAIPTFLGVANSAGDRAAQSNLTNALTEVKALYQNNAAYTNGGAVMAPAFFTGSAPEFSWTAAACTGASAGNCVSVQVVDAASAGDSQGVELSVYSAKTQTCWYAVDLETSPANFAALETAPAVNFATTASHTQPGATTAGVFYAKQQGGTAAAHCSGGYPATETVTTSWNWGGSYSGAGSN
jgi:type IV pilus assembly protein PilA